MAAFGTGLGAAAASGGLVWRLLLRGPAVPAPLRPPGARPEAEFLALCIRCDRCQDACAAGAIALFDEGAGAATHTPHIRPRVKACDLCLACIPACPTGALAPVARREDVRMGVARVDARMCPPLAGRGVCGACYPACPLRGKAITIGMYGAPTVHPAACVGCGLCEEACIIADKAIRVVTGDRS